MSRDSEHAPPPQAPEGFQASLSEFIQTRIELVRLEAREAGRDAAKRAALAIFAIGCSILCWLLVMAGLIGLVAAQKPEWPWYLVALAAGGLHLLAALIALLAMRRPSSDPFPLTRSEFAKDREWLDRLNNDLKPPR